MASRMQASVVAAHGLRSCGFLALKARNTGSVVVLHGLRCSPVCRVFPDQGSNLCLLHWQGDSLLLRHQGRQKTLCFHFLFCMLRKGSLGGSVVRSPPAMQETQEMWIRSRSWKAPLEEDTATHSRILAWRIPWTEEPGGLQSMGSQRVRHD